MKGAKVCFEGIRLEGFLSALERLAAGDHHQLVPISPARDELDAIAHGVNVMALELHHRLAELQDAQSKVVQSGKLAALGEVSSGLAHELNNPLTIVVGYLEHLGELVKKERRADADERKIEEFIEKIDRNLTRMAGIIGHIMEFSRHSRPARRTLVLNDVIRKSFILVKEQLRLGNIRLETDLDVSNDLVTIGDSLRLEQVFINLLSNARDAVHEAHGESGGMIRVATKSASEREIEVEISDNGIGMSEEVQGKIFNPFFTTKDVGKGTGLGLSISLRIVQDHGGSIDCASRPGKGTSFRIRLPKYLPELDDGSGRGEA